MEDKRETFASRIGFIMISAGCAIGLGNVWRFPYIVGQYGGAAFVLVYLVFLVILGLPIMVMEFANGRASKKSVALSYDKLEPAGTKWHYVKWFHMAGDYILMMFYTTIAGWLMNYFVKFLRGDFSAGMSAEAVSAEFNNMLADPSVMAIYMLIVVILCFFVCGHGLQNGVENISQKMMACLIILMLVMAVNSCLIPGGSEGLSFYLKPDFSRMQEAGIFNALYAAMGQAFFTLSIGIGALAIFGSYIGDERRLAGEGLNVMLLDTLVAFVAGLIIFPACYAYNGGETGQGPSLVFVTLPNVFNNMQLGRLWGSMFFLFMTFAALTTIIAVFQNIISFATDLTGCSVKRAVGVNGVIIAVLSFPALLGYNLLSGVQPIGAGSTILDLEDFIVSNNILPIGSMIYLLFCTRKCGWGWKNFTDEANKGKGIKFPTGKAMRFYVSFIIPAIVLIILVMGYVDKFF
ncbi:MAG: sodium-dependent transporter [Eubacteriales bacterium]|nr:sodium-dependent transporter [Eubacteriales bacterium]